MDINMNNLLEEKEILIKRLKIAIENQQWYEAEDIILDLQELEARFT